MSPPPDFTGYGACTIVSNNYLAFARVLADSFLRHHPGARFWVLVADRPSADLDYEAEEFEVVFADQLEIQAFESFAFRHSILEFNTAVKPYFLEYLDRQFAPTSLCYLDPDILVLDDLAPVFEELGEADLVLTPHVTRPVTDDRKPGERDLLLAGAYNLGFLGVSFNRETRAFLHWWQEKLYLDCRHRVRDGLFVDQRWMDLAPSLVERVHILRDPGYNVAYWNLIHRTVRRHEETGRWSANGSPLRFYHFSGIDPTNLEILSKHQDRFVLGDRPDVAPLFERYAELLEAAGHSELLRIDYGFGRFANGVPIPACAREALRETDPRGLRWSRPFDTDGADTYFDWLRRCPEGDTMPRIAHFAWESRDDLRRGFPEPAGASALAFARWLGEGGANDLGIHGVFLEAFEELAGTGGRPATGDRADWLAGDAGLEPDASPRVPRMAMQLRESRHDLNRAFPDPLGASRRRFAMWYVTYGRREYGLGPELVNPVLHSLDLGGRLHARLWWIVKGQRRAGRDER